MAFHNISKSQLKLMCVSIHSCCVDIWNWAHKDKQLGAIKPSQEESVTNIVIKMITVKPWMCKTNVENSVEIRPRCLFHHTFNMDVFICHCFFFFFKSAALVGKVSVTSLMDVMKKCTLSHFSEVSENAHKNRCIFSFYIYLSAFVHLCYCVGNKTANNTLKFPTLDINGRHVWSVHLNYCITVMFLSSFMFLAT